MQPFLEDLKKQIESGSVKQIIPVFLFIALMLFALSFSSQDSPNGAAIKTLPEKDLTPIEPACIPTTEVCDAVDNDCDGYIDEGNACGRLEKTVSILKNSFEIIKEQGYDVIDLPDSHDNFEIGEPSVPFDIVHVVIPPGFEIQSIETRHSLAEELPDIYDILPTPPPEPCCDEKIDMEGLGFVQKGPSAYDLLQPYPAKLVKVLNTGVMAGHNIATLQIFHFQYDPENGKLNFYEDVEFDVLLKETTSSTKPASNPFMNNIIKSVVINPENLTSSLARSPTTNIDYLIITDSAHVSDFQRLAVHKEEFKDLATEILTTEYIYNKYDGEDEQAKIRTAIIDYYNAGTIWVLLGGDETIVPIRYCYHSYADEMPSLSILQICDLYYADADGDWDTDGDGIYGEYLHDNADFYPEVYLGRVPLRNSNDIGHWIDKLIDYETNPGNGDASYLFNVVYAVADQMRDWDYGEGQHKLIADEFPENFKQDFESLVEQPSGNSPIPNNPLSGQSIMDELDKGNGITIILNHGRVDGIVMRSKNTNEWPKIYLWASGAMGDGHAHLNYLNNLNKPGLINAVSCDFGAFDSLGNEDPWGPSLTEEFLKAENKGAVAIVANSRWGWVSSSYKVTKKFYEYLFSVEDAKHIGVAHVIAKANFPYYREQHMGLNLYGDPEMVIYRNVNDLPELPVSCWDSDSGVNTIVAGTCTDTAENNYADYCSGDDIVEAYCKTTGTKKLCEYYSPATCSTGCSNGKCNPTCIETSGNCTDSSGQYSNYCASYGVTAVKYKCSSPYGTCETNNISCTNGCTNGKCKTTECTPYYDKKLNKWVYPTNCGDDEIT